MADEKTRIGLVMRQTRIERGEGAGVEDDCTAEIETQRTEDIYDISEVLERVEAALKEAIKDDEIITFSAEIVPDL